MVDLTGQLLKKQYAGTADAGPHAALVFLAAMTCEPLYLVAQSCRNHITRCRAIELLRRWRRREGIWDSMLAATGVQASMLREESGAEAEGSRDGECGCVRGVYV